MISKIWSTLVFLFFYGACLIGATIIFDNKSHTPLYVVTGSSTMKPLREEWVRAGTQTTLNAPFKRLNYLIMYQPVKNNPRMKVSVKTLTNLGVSPFGKIYILYFDPKHVTVVKK